jgi:hypothetical protein
MIKWDDATFDRAVSYKRGDGMQRMQPQPARSKDADGFGRPGTRLLWRVISKNEPYSGLECLEMVYVTIKYTKKTANSVIRSN